MVSVASQLGQPLPYGLHVVYFSDGPSRYRQPKGIGASYGVFASQGLLLYRHFPGETVHVIGVDSCLVSIYHVFLQVIFLFSARRRRDIF